MPRSPNFCFCRSGIPIAIIFRRIRPINVDEALTAARNEKVAIGQDDLRFDSEEATSRPLDPPGDNPAQTARERAGQRRRRRWMRRLSLALAGLFLLLIAAALVIYVVGVDAIGNERLRQQAELALTRMVGEDVDVQLGRLELRPGTTSLFALEVQNARIALEDDGAFIARAGTLRFGIRALPLLFGRVELSQVMLADADLSAATLQPLFGSGEPKTVFTATEAETAVFDAVRTLFASMLGTGISRFRFQNVALLGENDEPLLRLERLDFRVSGERRLHVEGALQIAGQDLALDGEAEREPDTGLVSELAVRVAVDGVGRLPRNDMGGVLRQFGRVDATLQGTETDPNGAWLLADLKLGDFVLMLQKEELDLKAAALRIRMHREEDAFSIVDSSVSIGRSLVTFGGTVRPETGRPDTYRFDFLSRNSLLAPRDSTEEPLRFASRFTGIFDISQTTLTAEQLEVVTDNGGVSLSGGLVLKSGQAPGISLDLRVDQLPTAEAKQLWPWFAAPGTRRWVMDNLFGGMLRDSHLRYSVAPGRLANGVPLSKDEFNGQFNIYGARFDLVGHLPAVRDSDGWVDIEGTDVLVGLTKGAAYLPSGRVVHTGGGVMEIAATHLRPRIGKLAIDISGDAQAVAEFASLPPINASFLDLKPEDLSGRVSGHVRADIPLSEGVPRERLGWAAELSYEQLSIAKPVDGQIIRNATGTMEIDRTSARISANAELNGLVAKVELVEPLGGVRDGRKRHIEMEVNDEARGKMFPGLGQLVSGPMEVSFEQGSGKDRRIEVNLLRAKLSVPWIGWEKGAGIPARASFVLKDADGQMELSDFRLTGETFGLAGRVIVAQGRLREANFSNVRFNRDDDLSVDIRARGNGYDVVARGNSFDARSVIKLVTGKDTKPEDASAGTPIKLQASLKQVTGFHDVRLEQVTAEYASGNGPDRLSIRAATPVFGSVIFARWTEGGQRQLRLQSENGGAVLRFLNFYRYMEGGKLNLQLAGLNDNALRGRIQINDFWVVNEPRLSSLVAASSKSGKPSKSVDVTRVQFGTAFADIAKGKQRVDLANGIIRGPTIGFAFQGTLFDEKNNTNMTGTFMPAYGLNRIFGEIPLIGQILGNGRDRGLIGITFRVVGPFDQPNLEINPISAIAPGIFRQIFEFD